MISKIDLSSSINDWVINYNLICDELLLINSNISNIITSLSTYQSDINTASNINITLGSLNTLQLKSLIVDDKMYQFIKRLSLYNIRINKLKFSGVYGVDSNVDYAKLEIPKFNFTDIINSTSLITTQGVKDLETELLTDNNILNNLILSEDNIENRLTILENKNKKDIIVKTNEATVLSSTSVKLSGELVDTGLEKNVNVYFYYKLRGDDTYTKTPYILTSSLGYFEFVLTDLKVGATYDYQSAVVGTIDTLFKHKGYSVDFTLFIDPSLKLLSVSQLTVDSCTIKSILYDFGSYDVNSTKYLIEYKKTTDIAFLSSTVNNLFTTGDFKTIIKNLTINTEYYFRVKLYNTQDDKELISNAVLYKTANNSDANSYIDIQNIGYDDTAPDPWYSERFYQQDDENSWDQIKPTIELIGKGNNVDVNINSSAFKGYTDTKECNLCLGDDGYTSASMGVGTALILQNNDSFTESTISELIVLPNPTNFLPKAGVGQTAQPFNLNGVSRIVKYDTIDTDYSGSNIHLFSIDQQNKKLKRFKWLGWDFKDIETIILPNVPVYFEIINTYYNSTPTKLLLVSYNTNVISIYNIDSVITLITHQTISCKDVNNISRGIRNITFCEKGYNQPTYVCLNATNVSVLCHIGLSSNNQLSNPKTIYHGYTPSSNVSDYLLSPVRLFDRNDGFTDNDTYAYGETFILYTKINELAIPNKISINVASIDLDTNNDITITLTQTINPILPAVKLKSFYTYIHKFDDNVHLITNYLGWYKLNNDQFIKYNSTQNFDDLELNQITSTTKSFNFNGKNYILLGNSILFYDDYTYKTEVQYNNTKFLRTNGLDSYSGGLEICTFEDIVQDSISSDYIMIPQQNKVSPRIYFISTPYGLVDTSYFENKKHTHHDMRYKITKFDKKINYIPNNIYRGGQQLSVSMSPHEDHIYQYDNVELENIEFLGSNRIRKTFQLTAKFGDNIAFKYLNTTKNVYTSSSIVINGATNINDLYAFDLTNLDIINGTIATNIYTASSDNGMITTFEVNKPLITNASLKTTITVTPLEIDTKKSSSTTTYIKSLSPTELKKYDRVFVHQNNKVGNVQIHEFRNVDPSWYIGLGVIGNYNVKGVGTGDRIYTTNSWVKFTNSWVKFTDDYGDTWTDLGANQGFGANTMLLVDKGDNKPTIFIIGGNAGLRNTYQGNGQMYYVKYSTDGGYTYKSFGSGVTCYTQEALYSDKRTAIRSLDYSKSTGNYYAVFFEDGNDAFILSISNNFDNLYNTSVFRARDYGAPQWYPQNGGVVGWGFRTIIGSIHCTPWGRYYYSVWRGTYGAWINGYAGVAYYDSGYYYTDDLVHWFLYLQEDNPTGHSFISNDSVTLAYATNSNSAYYFVGSATPHYYNILDNSYTINITKIGNRFYLQRGTGSIYFSDNGSTWTFQESAPPNAIGTTLSSNKESLLYMSITRLHSKGNYYLYGLNNSMHGIDSTATDSWIAKGDITLNYSYDNISYKEVDKYDYNIDNYNITILGTINKFIKTLSLTTKLDKINQNQSINYIEMIIEEPINTNAGTILDRLTCELWAKD